MHTCKNWTSEVHVTMIIVSRVHTTDKTGAVSCVFFSNRLRAIRPWGSDNFGGAEP